jgi:tRNA(Arg) A34 adenosine deaminase TadA
MSEEFREEIRLSIPSALAAEAAGVVAKEAEERMRWVIRWSAENVERGEGPFAAAVFDMESGRCVSAGVNRVVSGCCSAAHAEMMALMLAQQALGHFSLAEKGRFVLSSSAQPCAQCFGAIPWSGVIALEYGASREDVEAIGFDEGPVHPAWREELEARGIQVSGPLLQTEAAEVLQAYARRGGEVYNG